MIICPHCQSENRIGAKFCKNCASQLPVSSTVTKPLDQSHASSASLGNPRETIRLDPVTQRRRETSRKDTQPLAGDFPFIQRPPGAIFNDTFLYQNLVFSNDHQHQYLVTQLDVPEDDRIRVCPNPACGAFFPPRGAELEKYCTDCGTVIEVYRKDLVIAESAVPFSDHLTQLVAKGLSHGGVRAPLVAFVEQIGGSKRYCLLTVPVAPLDCVPDTLQVLNWGVDLSRGLDYLHDNGITYNGQIDSSCFGLVGDRMVWVNFSRSVHHQDGYVVDRKPDVLSLARFLYKCLTGKTQFDRDPNLAPGVNHAFEAAMTAPGPENGRELAQIFEAAFSETAAPHAVDFRVGRRTHVGMIRDLNEDSLLTLELNRTQQSFSQPLGVFVVADGMGGHSGGEIASGAIVNLFAQKAVTELLPDQITQKNDGDHSEWLRKTVEAANQEVLKLRKSVGTDMGSTMVAVVLEKNRAYIAHVGDSRVYLVNDQGIKQLTTDHSLVERLIATQQITREEARVHPQRNVIYRTIGDKPMVEVDVQALDLSVGDVILLCSDGLSGMVQDRAIYNIVQGTNSPQMACDELINAANAAGGEDNIAAVMVKIVST